MALCFLTLILSVFAVSAAHGQWTTTGMSICGGTCRAEQHVAVPDGGGGMFIAWCDERDPFGTGGDIYLQRITRSGTVSAGWPVGGVPVAVLSGTQHTPSLAVDGMGGVFVAWGDGRNAQLGYGGDIYLQRVCADGSIAPGWLPNGSPVVTGVGHQDWYLVCPDGSGGAFVAWTNFGPPPPGEKLEPVDVYAQHLLADGTIAPNWPAEGQIVCDAPYDQVCTGILPDANGNVLISWSDGRAGDFYVFDTYAQHLLATGEVAPEWTPGGKLLMAGRGKPRLSSDEAGGFFVAAATTDYFASDKDYYLQRYSFSGNQAPGWPEGGLLVCTAPDSRYGLVTAPDGLGGVLMTWYDYRTASIEIFALRVGSDGTLPPGWTPNGVLLSDLTSPYAEADPCIAPDGVGGAYVAWERDPKVIVQHLSAQGSVAPGWPSLGTEVAPTQFQTRPAIVPDNAGGAMVIWDESSVSRPGLYAQRFVDEGPVAVQIALASVVASSYGVTLVWRGHGAASLVAYVERRTTTGGWSKIATPNSLGHDGLQLDDRDVVPGARYAYRLRYEDDGADRFTPETWVDVPTQLSLDLEGFRPNPLPAKGHIAFVLPRTGEARLEVIDVSGRRVLSRDVGGLGAGRHLVALEEPLAPGVYLARLTHGGRTVQVRGAVIR